MLECDVCKKTFDSKENYYKHIQEEHTDPTNKYITERNKWIDFYNKV
jgi:uncharacterized C2H2 Zn-finger protein